MDIWNKIKSTLGLTTDEDNIDQNGVDHSNMSIRDELEYQLKNINKKDEIAVQQQKQDILTFAKTYAEPSVKKAIEEAKRVNEIPISDVNKHQYISCIGSTGGALATAETLAGGVYKEYKDLKNKLLSQEQRKAYGGISGVFEDSKKDLINDVIGASAGYVAGKSHVPEVCDVLLRHPLKFDK